MASRYNPINGPIAAVARQLAGVSHVGLPGRCLSRSVALKGGVAAIIASVTLHYATMLGQTRPEGMVTTNKQGGTQIGRGQREHMERKFGAGLPYGANPIQLIRREAETWPTGPGFWEQLLAFSLSVPKYSTPSMTKQRFHPTW